MSDYYDNEIEELYDQLQMPLIRHLRTFFLCVEGDWNAKVGEDVKTGKEFVDPSAMTTQIREDSDFWRLPPLTKMDLA